MVIIQVQESNPAIDPIVVSFPSGIPQGLQDGSLSEPPTFLWRRQSKESKGRTLIGKDATCLYQAGTSEDDHRHTKLCVGVYHKGKLVLYPAAARGAVLSLSQSVLSYVSTKPDEKLTAVQRRKALFDDFGSQKKRRVMRSQEANIVNVDSVIGTGAFMMGALTAATISDSNRIAMEATKTGTKIDAVEVSYLEARNNFLPPFDSKATDPHLVYQPQDIAGIEAWDRISRMTDACLRKNNVIGAVTERGEWHDVVKTILNSISLESPNAKQQIKTCILLNSLLTFQFKRKTIMRGTAEQVARKIKISKELCQRFLELFTSPLEKGGFGTSKEEKAKCLLFILILFIIAQGREMKVNTIKPIAEACKMELIQAAISLREAGFTVQSNGMGAALKVPLTFPGPKKRGGRGQ